MFKLRLVKKEQPLKLKCNFNFPEIILANLQEKEVIPTKEQQQIVPDKNYDGLSKVIVDKIPDEYIIPTGNIEIIKNGIYDVREKESATVNIPEPKLGTKNITQNGIYKASDDELDGYSEVNVAVNNSIFSGSYDRTGLKQIGWTDEEIDYYNDNGVQWNEEENDFFKLNSVELASNDSSDTRFLPKNTTKKNFQSYYKLLALPSIDFSDLTSLFGMFTRCYSLTAIPQLDISNATNMSAAFGYCYSLETIPKINTSKVTSMYNTFYYCYSLKTIPQLDTSNVTNMEGMFNYCYSLKTIPKINTSKVTSMGSMFKVCNSLTAIPQLDTSNVTNMVGMFSGCNSLTVIPQLDTSKVNNIREMFSGCYSLMTLNGLLNLGQAYLITASANFLNYTLELSSTKLTEQSIINVLNNLYDIATKGCQVQKVNLGTTNLAKLTSEEGQQALSNAQSKGWSIS